MDEIVVVNSTDITVTNTTGDEYQVEMTSGSDVTVDVSATAINGVGVPGGGTTGQVLGKSSNTSYDTAWINNTEALPYEASTANIKMDGSVSVGSLTTIPRADHIHPTDTTRVSANSSITAGTKTKITYDVKGLVTAGADATTADIADSANKRYVTDAQLSVLSNTSGTNTGDSASLPIGGGTMTGNITLGENTAIAYDPVLSADGKYTGITRTGTAGAALAFGDLVYLDPTDSRWEKTDANSAAGADGDARGIVGIVVLAANADGDATNILLHGVIRADAKFPTFTVNNPIYVSETAGEVTGTQPTTTDAVIRVVGFGLTGDEMFFCPSNDYITHT